MTLHYDPFPFNERALCGVLEIPLVVTSSDELVTCGACLDRGRELELTTRPLMAGSIEQVTCEHCLEVAQALEDRAQARWDERWDVEG